jgi:hypothetical protein
MPHSSVHPGRPARDDGAAGERTGRVAVGLDVDRFWELMMAAIAALG